MRKLMFALAMLFGTTVALYAQDTTQTQDPSEQYRTEEQTQDPAEQSQDPAQQDPAQEQQQPQEGDDAMNQDDQDKDLKPVSVSELPEAVRSQLASQDYSGYAVTEAFVKEKDGETCYKVKLSNGTETKKVEFDAEGNVIENKEKDQDQK